MGALNYLVESSIVPLSSFLELAFVHFSIKENDLHVSFVLLITL